MVKVPSECCLCLKREAAAAHTTAFRVSVSWFYWYRFLMFTWSRWGSVRLSSTECWQTEEPTEGRSYREVSPFVPTAFPAKTNPIARYWTWEKQKDDESGCFYFIYSFTQANFPSLQGFLLEDRWFFLTEGPGRLWAAGSEPVETIPLQHKHSVTSAYHA